MTLAAVIFDFDFTLVDSSRGFIECHDHACRELALPPLGAETSTAMMGTPLRDAFRLLFPEEHPTTADTYVRLWQLRADEVMTDLTEIYPETQRVLAGLQSAGLRLGIVSQKLRHRIEAVLHREGLQSAFDVVVGGDDVGAFKPDPAGIRAAAGRLGVSPAETIYVGDTVIDAQAALNAGAPFVAVLSGVTPAEAVAPFPAVAVLDGIGGLPDLCRSLS